MNHQPSFHSNIKQHLPISSNNENSPPQSLPSPQQNPSDKKQQNPSQSTNQLFLSLTSTIQGLYSKIQNLKQIHGNISKTSRCFVKKNMDVSQFPMPNLTHNQFINTKFNLSKSPSLPNQEDQLPQNMQCQLKKIQSSPYLLDSPTSKSYPTLTKDNSNYNPIPHSPIPPSQLPSTSSKTIPTSQNSTYYEDSNFSNTSINKNYSCLALGCKSNQQDHITPIHYLKTYSTPNQCSIITTTQFDNQHQNLLHFNVKKTNSIVQHDDDIQNTDQPSHHIINSQPQIQIKHIMSVPNLKSSMQINDKIHANSMDTNTSQTNDFISQLQKIISKQSTQTTILSIQQPIPNISLKDFQLGKLIGSGKFGDVHICRHKKTGLIFALKKIFKSTILSYNMITQFIKQLTIHSKLTHPNIIKLYSYFDDQYHIFLLMQYADSGILMNKLKCSQDLVSKFIDQTIDAVQYLHQCNITHRDIKPQNIVLQFQNTVKLCDFGWATYYNNQMKTTFCGTLDYISPQMKQKGQYDNNVDLWSIGILTFQLLTGTPPHRRQFMLSMKPTSKPRKINWNINYPPYLSTLSQSFIRNLLKQNPKQRASLRFCSNHTFIRKYKQQLQELMFFEEFTKVVW